jgi:biopolymer transport protein ExbB/TolQ
MGEQNWQLFLFLAGLLMTWSLLILGVAKLVMGRETKENEKRFAALEEKAKDFTKLERAYLELKADLPLQYVRKEDDIRQQVTINAKLDRLAEKIEALLSMRGPDE